MATLEARVVSVHVGAADTLEKSEQERIHLELDGIVGDRHRGIQRACWDQDKQPAGSLRRNERMWSAVSAEELAAISETMDLTERLSAATVGANICVKGIDDFSRLPRGTLLSFESGAVLMVEEYNPPCSDMGTAIAAAFTTRAGAPPEPAAFSAAAKFSRGLVGVIEVAGSIAQGDRVTVTPESLPKWLRR